MTWLRLFFISACAANLASMSACRDRETAPPLNSSAASGGLNTAEPAPGAVSQTDEADPAANREAALENAPAEDIVAPASEDNRSESTAAETPGEKTTTSEEPPDSSSRPPY